MISTYLPYRQIRYQTDLTPVEIQQILAENVITGFSFVNSKPYCGSFSNYDFSVRKTYSSIKKQSIKPTVTGRYQSSEGKTYVTLTLMPHSIQIIFVALFGLPCLLFLVNGFSEFLKTWDITILVNCFFPVLILYGILWGIFQFQGNADLRFWEHTLSLKNVVNAPQNGVITPF
ncbi:hypothetical protein [Runella sp.]|uniref:hypothetical protein n=1 Tax=Runella sp. TaxID=1960881 RepID=UPI0030172CDF